VPVHGAGDYLDPIAMARIPGRTGDLAAALTAG
jgi:hypothetical protein